MAMVENISEKQKCDDLCISFNSESLRINFIPPHCRKKGEHFPTNNMYNADRISKIRKSMAEKIIYDSILRRIENQRNMHNTQTNDSSNKYLH